MRPVSIEIFSYAAGVASSLGDETEDDLGLLKDLLNYRYMVSFR